MRTDIASGYPAELPHQFEHVDPAPVVVVEPGANDVRDLLRALGSSSSGHRASGPGGGTRHPGGGSPARARDRANMGAPYGVPMWFSRDFPKRSVGNAGGPNFLHKFFIHDEVTTG